MDSYTALAQTAGVREMFAEFSAQQAGRDVELGYRELVRQACLLLVHHHVELPPDLQEFRRQMLCLAPLWVAAQPSFEALEAMEDSGKDVNETGNHADSPQLRKAYELNAEISGLLGEFRRWCEAVGRRSRRLQAFEKAND